MKAKNVLDKYRISDEELLHIKAMFNGTTMHCKNEDLDKMPAARRGPVAHHESFDDKVHNRAMTLFMMLPNKELAAIVSEEIEAIHSQRKE